MKKDQKPNIGLTCLAVLIIAATLVIAGCMESTQGPQDQVTAANDKQSKNPAAGAFVATGTTAAPAPLKTTQTASAPAPSTPFITIDPIGNKTTGDLIIFSGTTNLPPASPVYLKEINESTGEPAVIANAIACPDSRGENRWTVVFDSTDSMRPGEYRYLVSTPGGEINSSVQFNLSGTFLGPEAIRYYQDGSKTATISGSGSYPYITVDPIGDRHEGDIFRISGITNLVEGTMLYGTVWPVYYEDRSKRPATISKDPCDWQFNMIGYPVAVVKGTGDTNRWSFPVDTIMLPKTGMIVHVSTVNEAFTVKEFYGNATFNLT
ncbi:MAG: hypothetical protein ABSB80_00385 [Methanoregula sp.]|jgi:hypothetical protein|uniref:hypothetical protein n=1 Tax=Methanoregula sp. TaxID=2052170 RepID=UPI003D15198D